MGQAHQQMPAVVLSATHFLDDNWESVRDIPPASADLSEDDQKELDWIRGISIAIAPHAETVKLTPPPGGPNFDYLKSELGMNIILPEGRLDELRFEVKLTRVGGTLDMYATDGFPKGKIHRKAIVDGQIEIGISKAFKLIPVIGGVVSDLVNVEFNPWNFRIGSLQEIDVAFSGALTATLTWYFKTAGIENNEIRVAMIIKKPRDTALVKADVRAGWRYKPPGLMTKKRVGTDSKTVMISS
jgi:hypothetical protein